MKSILNTNSGRFLLLKSFGCSPIVAIVGHTQVGKSTFLYWLANEITKIKFYLGLSKEAEWNYKILCARSFDEFKLMVENNNNSVIAVEEASFQLDTNEYWSIENKLFKTIMETQGYKRNIYILCFPSLKGIAKQHRLGIDFVFSVERKNEMYKSVLVKPNYIKKRFWLLGEKNFKQIWLNKFKLEYSEEFLKKTIEYTNWLKEFKVDIMKTVDIKYEKSKNKGKRKKFELNMNNETIERIKL